MERQRVVFMGTPAMVLPVLNALASADVAIAAVYCQPDRPQGRGLDMEPPPTKRWAMERGIPVFQPLSLRKPEAHAQLAALRPDVLVVAAYGRFLPPEVLRIPPHGGLNVHPSLLPKYRGPSPVAAAILNGDPVTGVTIMLVDEGMDTGPIVAVREEPVRPTDTTASLTDRLFHLGADLLRDTLPQWVYGEITAQPQEDALATLTKRFEKDDGEAAFTLTAVELERRLRAFTPWPGLSTRWRGRVLKIVEARAIAAPPGSPDGPPGLVVPLREPDAPMGIVCREGILALQRVQLEGKRPAAASEFANGYRDFIGAQLPS